MKDPDSSQEPDLVDLRWIQEKIFEVSNHLAQETQNPMWKAGDLGWASSVPVAMKMALDLKLFQMIDGPTTIQDLQRKTDADFYVLHRLMRLLSAERWVKQTGPDTFEPNRFTIFATQQTIQDWIKMSWDVIAPVAAQVPAYFAARSYQAPSSAAIDPPVKRAFNFSTLFEWLVANPEQMSVFASAMRIQQLQSPAYFASFPFTSELQRSPSLEPNETIVVDVGGGLGHWLEQVLTENPSLAAGPGKFILQDLPSVIDDPACTNNTRIEKQKHDFFTKQAVQGARYYHMRGILHDWPDDNCIRILENLAPAFRKASSESDYSSKLLITGFALPSMGCTRSMAMNDVGMMLLNGMERTVEHYDSLLKKTGFRFLKTWKAQLGEFCVIEAELA